MPSNTPFWILRTLRSFWAKHLCVYPDSYSKRCMLYPFWNLCFYSSSLATGQVFNILVFIPGRFGLICNWLRSPEWNWTWKENRWLKTSKQVKTWRRKNAYCYHGTSNHKFSVQLSSLRPPYSLPTTNTAFTTVEEGLKRAQLTTSIDHSPVAKPRSAGFNGNQARMPFFRHNAPRYNFPSVWKYPLLTLFLFFFLPRRKPSKGPKPIGPHFYDGLGDLIPHQPAYSARPTVSRTIAIVCRTYIRIVQVPTWYIQK